MRTARSLYFLLFSTGVVAGAAFLALVEILDPAGLPYVAGAAAFALLLVIWKSRWLGTPAALAYVLAGILTVHFSGGALEAHFLIVAVFLACIRFLDIRALFGSALLLAVFYGASLAPGLPLRVFGEPALKSFVPVAGCLIAAGLLQIWAIRFVNDQQAHLKSFLHRLGEAGTLDFRFAGVDPGENKEYALSLQRLSSTVKNFYLDLQTSLEHGREMNAKLHGFVSNFSRTAEAQSKSIQGASATIAEFSSSIQEIESNIAGAARSTGEINDTVGDLTSSVHDLENSMGELVRFAGAARDSAQNTLPTLDRATEAMDQLSSIAEEIGKITGLITEISDQTNLLALNASIEAARAGEYGRGFAVVAEQVSKLADRTSASVKEIHRLVQDSRTTVQTSAGLVQQLADSINDNVVSHRNISEFSTKVMEMLGAQVKKIHEIAGGVGRLNQIAEAIESAALEQKRSAGDISDRMVSVSVEIQEVLGGTQNLHVISQEIDNFIEYAGQILEQMKVK